MKNPLRQFGVDLKEFDRLPEVNAEVNKVMDEVVSAWRGNSPVESGEYRDSIKVTKRSTTRGRGVVSATSPHAHFVEFGTANTPEYAPAEKTAKQFGGYAHDKPGTAS